jgi:hypothetical protein
MKEEIQATQRDTSTWNNIHDPCTTCVLLLLLFSCSYREHQHSQFNSSMHKYMFQCHWLLQLRNRVIKQCIHSYYAASLCSTKIAAHRLLQKRYMAFRWVTYWTHECTLHLFYIMKITQLNKRYNKKRLHNINPLMLELNPSAQRCLTRFFTEDFASWTAHFINICVKNQQMQQLFIQFINYIW